MPPRVPPDESDVRGEMRESTRKERDMVVMEADGEGQGEETS